MSHDDLASMGYPPSTPSHEEMVSARSFDGHSTQKQNNGVQRVGRSHVIWEHTPIVGVQQQALELTTVHV